MKISLKEFGRKFFHPRAQTPSNSAAGRKTLFGSLLGKGMLLIAMLAIHHLLPIVYAALPYKPVFTRDASLPWHFWWRSPSRSTYERGDYVEIKVWFQNEYVANVRYLVKEVACKPGERLTVRERSFYCDGRFLGEAQTADKNGRPMNLFRFDGLIPEDHYFVLGSHPRSYDSRYWGLLSVEYVTAKLYPLSGILTVTLIIFMAILIRGFLQRRRKSRPCFRGTLTKKKGDAAIFRINYGLRLRLSRFSVRS